MPAKKPPSRWLACASQLNATAPGRDECRQQPRPDRPLTEAPAHVGVGEHDDAAQFQPGHRRERPQQRDAQLLHRAGDLPGEGDGQHHRVEAAPDAAGVAHRTAQIGVELTDRAGRAGAP